MNRQEVERSEMPFSGRFTKFLRGPRYVDLPIRVLALLIGAAGLTPDALEATDPSYWALQILATILIIGVCFYPVTAGLIGYVAFAVFATNFPDLINPFQTVSEVTVAFILSQLRLRLAFTFTLLHFTIMLIPTSLGMWGGGREPIITLAFGWLLAVVLGLLAAAVDQRIEAEVSRRADLARVHQRKLEKIRLDMALDTHDIVSHGLATEAAIVRTLEVEARQEGRSDSKLTELALVNAHTQQQLRVLLSRLTDSAEVHSEGTNFEIEMLRAAEMIRSATDAGGVDINISVSNLPSEVSAELLETALFILKELATNIVKHSSDGAVPVITVQGGSDPDAFICLASVNSSPIAPECPPRSLSARIHRIGGSLTLSYRDGLLSVQATIPVVTGGSM